MRNDATDLSLRICFFIPHMQPAHAHPIPIRPTMLRHVPHVVLFPSVPDHCFGTVRNGEVPVLDVLVVSVWTEISGITSHIYIGMRYPPHLPCLCWASECMVGCLRVEI